MRRPLARVSSSLRLRFITHQLTQRAAFCRSARVNLFTHDLNHFRSSPWRPFSSTGAKKPRRFHSFEETSALAGRMQGALTLEAR